MEDLSLGVGIEGLVEEGGGMKRCGVGWGNHDVLEERSQENQNGSKEGFAEMVQWDYLKKKMVAYSENHERKGFKRSST